MKIIFTIGVFYRIKQENQEDKMISKFLASFYLFFVMLFVENSYSMDESSKDQENSSVTPFIHSKADKLVDYKNMNDNNESEFKGVEKIVGDNVLDKIQNTAPNIPILHKDVVKHNTDVFRDDENNKNHQVFAEDIGNSTRDIIIHQDDGRSHIPVTWDIGEGTWDTIIHQTEEIQGLF